MLYFIQVSLYLLAYFPIKLIFKRSELFIEVDNRADIAHKPLILVLNHYSKIDPFLLFLLPPSIVFRLAPIRFLTAEIYYNHPLIRLFIQPLGAYPLKKFAWSYRDFFSKSLSIINDKKQNILIFPEGKVILPNQIIEDKPGVGYLHSNSVAKILPVRLIGSETISFKNLLSGQIKLKMKVGREFTIKTGQKHQNTAQYKELSHQIMQEVYSL